MKSAPVAASASAAWPSALTTRLGAAAARFAWLALVALGLAWELWLAPTGSGTLALKVLPLLAVGPGLWRGRLYTHRVTSLLVWLYVAEGAVRATTERGLPAGLAAAEIALCLLLFGACVLRIRAQGAGSQQA